jgi:hypothetical protein
MARTIKFRVEALPHKDLDRRQRCLVNCSSYSGVMADFIAWLLQQGRTLEFADRVKEYEVRYYQQVCGQPNDARVAANLAVLAAAHAQFAEYLGDVWPSWQSEVKRFGEEQIPALLTEMMGAVREQRPIEIFWNTLCDLVAHGRVRLYESEMNRNAPIIGKYLPASRNLVCVASGLALAEVQKSLADQQRPSLPLRPADIPGLLRKEGKLVDEAGRTISPDGAAATAATKQLRIECGGPAIRCFIVNQKQLCADLDSWGVTATLKQSVLRRPLSQSSRLETAGVTEA